MRRIEAPVPCSSPRDNSGFSVLETLMVLALVGIAIIPLSEIQMSSHRSVEDADRYSEAVSLAQEQLESMRALGFANAAQDTLQFGNFTIAQGPSPYLDPVSGAPLPSLERLRVAVSWRERGEVRRIEMDCLQAER